MALPYDIVNHPFTRSGLLPAAERESLDTLFQVIITVVTHSRTTYGMGTGTNLNSWFRITSKGDLLWLPVIEPINVFPSPVYRPLQVIPTLCALVPTQTRHGMYALYLLFVLSVRVKLMDKTVVCLTVVVTIVA